MKKLKLPILKKFEHKHIPLNGNHLRDKYPDVNFKDEDINWYDYESYKRQELIANQFLKQYDVKDLIVSVDYGSFKNITYLFDVKLERATHIGSSLTCKNGFTLKKDGFDIKYDDFEGGVTINIKLNKNKFEFSGAWRDGDVEIEINPDRKILDDYVSFFVDKLFEKYNDETVIYKNPNGYMYYTAEHCIHKVLSLYSDGKKCDISLEIENYDAVEPFKKYKESYSVKVMPKKSKQISFKQLKIEFSSICNYVIKNKISILERVWKEDSLKKIFKSQNVKIKCRYKDYNFSDEFFITEHKKKNKYDQNIDTCSIYKKDKLIGSYEGFSEVGQEVKDEILNFLVEKFGDDLELDLMDSDVELFVNRLNLYTYENEEYSGDYFLYQENFDFGKYKMTINSSRYIKDMCICDLTADSMDIYLKK